MVTVCDCVFNYDYFWSCLCECLGTMSVTESKKPMGTEVEVGKGIPREFQATAACAPSRNSQCWVLLMLQWGGTSC